MLLRIRLFPIFLALDDRDVAIYREACQTLRRASGHRPFHFKPVDLLPHAPPEHHSRIVRRKIASTTYFHLVPLQIPCLIRNLRSDCVRIALLSHEFHAQPVVLFPRVVTEQQRRSVVHGNKNIHRAIVIEVSKRQAACRELPSEERSTFRADILEPRTRVLKKKHWLTVSDPRIDHVDEIVRMSVDDKQIQVSIVVVIEELHSPAAHHLTGPRRTQRPSPVLEGFILFLLIQTLEFGLRMCHYHSHPAVPAKSR